VSTTAKAAANQPSATDAPTQAPAQESADVQVGSEVGMMCPDFTVPLYGTDGGEFSLSACKGKPVIINFWATWCTPCVNELPHFQKIYDELSDKIELVAIHSELITDDVQEYLDGQGYTMPFALDSDGSVIASLGGSTMLPMTVVVDAEGRIVYNKVGSITYELL
ncbi:MAG: TlpA family protein disulfide reductase, partial [Christensenellales bacterium]